jgi:exonuclease SbcC
VKLLRLSIGRLPGIDRPFELEDLGDGLNIICGPNGMGKSRICTTVRALLWHERGIANDALTARADFVHEGTPWQVVRDGSLHRWQRDGFDAPPPSLPGERLDGCYFLGLRDLLDDSDRAGRDLASEIRRQMSGGFDLEAIVQRFKSSVPTRVGSKESKALAAVENEIRRAELEQAEVERRERDLESLEARAAEAERALHRLAHYATAISLQTLRADFAQLKSELSEFPQALANFDGREVERLDKLEEELVQKRGEREAAHAELGDRREAASGTRLDAPIESSSLATWRERADNLAALERQWEAARLHATGAREALVQSRRSLGVYTPTALESGMDTALAIEDDFDLFAFLRDSHQLASETDAVQERLRLLVAREFSEHDARRLELLRRAVGSLRAWLRAPDPAFHEKATRLWPSRNFYILAGVTLTGIGLASQFIPSLVPFALLAVGAGIALVGAGAFSRIRADESDATDWRSISRRQLPEAIEPPRSWSIDSVAERLHELEDELAKHDSNEKRSRDRAVECGQLEESLNGFRQRATDLEVRRSDLAARLGVDRLRPDAELVDLARALDTARAAQVEAHSATTKADELEALVHEALQQISAHLTGLGEASPVDAAAARAGVHSLEERDRVLRSAISDGIREEKNGVRLDREIERKEAERADVFDTADVVLGDRAELGQRLRDLDRYRELKIESAKRVGGIERAESDLEAAGESALAEHGLAQLEQERAAIKRRSDERKDLDREIVEIGIGARNAREGHVLEDAIAKKNIAMCELHDRRDDALTALAGEFLIDRVRHDHETNQMPRVLERARSRFGAFTHHRYELRVSPNDGGSFVAVDTRSDEGLRPDQLSDGTRAQLILAARLAFAEEAEQGAELPLFLDEAMDHSDPERFHAIARSLARMVADEGRQIFYLSNDPTDVERFRAAFEQEKCDRVKTIDLAEVRGQATRIAERAALHVAPLAAVPSPAEVGCDGDPENYGVALGVTPLDPSHDALGQHLYYVLRDDLSLLHELLQARIELAGQCRNLLKGGSGFAKAIVGGSDVGAGLEARIDLLEIFCHAWKEGRGSQVARREIEASNAVSEKYLDAVVEVAADLAGDARQLIATLRDRKDSRLAGYRTRSARDLEEYFVDRGSIDDRPILTESQIVDRAIGTPAANLLTPKVAAELVHQWWTFSLHSNSH